MLRLINSNIVAIGRRLRNYLIFDISEPIDYSSFFELRFQKQQELAELSNKKRKKNVNKK